MIIIIPIISMRTMQRVRLPVPYKQKNLHFLQILKVYTKIQTIRATLISELTFQMPQADRSMVISVAECLPKLNNCIDAIDNGVSRVHILDGTDRTLSATGNLYKQRNRNSNLRGYGDEILP